MEALLHEEARGRKHATAAVSKLRLTQAINLRLGEALEDVRGVELAGRSDGTRKTWKRER